jgi:hypothetical protein
VQARRRWRQRRALLLLLRGGHHTVSTGCLMQTSVMRRLQHSGSRRAARVQLEPGGPVNARCSLMAPRPGRDLVPLFILCF